MGVKDTELFVALAAINNLVEGTSDGRKAFLAQLEAKDMAMIDAYVEAVVDAEEINGEDVLMAAIAVVKAKINELKETKE